MAGKPVYFFLSTGASVHVPRFVVIHHGAMPHKCKTCFETSGIFGREKNTMHEVYTLPEELRNGTYDKVRARVDERAILSAQTLGR